MLLFLLLLSFSVGSQAVHVLGSKNNGSCACQVDVKMFSFPLVKFEAVQDQVHTCQSSLGDLQEQVLLSRQRLPQVQALIQNLTARLQPVEYLHYQGLYSDLSLRRLAQELSRLETDAGAIHSQFKSPQTQKLSREVDKLRRDVERMTTSDTVNMKTVKEKLRTLKNTAESCKSIPQDYRGQGRFCMKGLISNISAPVMTKISPFGKSYISGSWGQQALLDSEEQKHSLWVQPLVNTHIWGNTFRMYPNSDDFMSATNHKDFTFAPSATHTNSIEGPSAVLYGDALYYHCYRSADVCRYDLKSNTVKRVTLPGTGVGFNNKFPYCYYDCRVNSDVDVEADETGLWAIYATVGNHGNLVVSRLEWSEEDETLNVTRTWETRQFKKAVSNAFMVCGVLYASRYVDDEREEVFYAFDTATGQESNGLSLSLQKVAKGVASLSYNPTNKQIYMYNDGYLLAYQAQFYGGSSHFYSAV